VKAKNKFRLAVLLAMALAIVWLLRAFTGGGGTPVSASSGAFEFGRNGEGLDAILARVAELERREAGNAEAGSLDRPTKLELQRLRFQLEAACRDSLAFAKAALRDNDAERMRTALASLRKLGSRASDDMKSEVESTLASLERRVGKV
jgi:hypothetical protein